MYLRSASTNFGDYWNMEHNEIHFMQYVSMLHYAITNEIYTSPVIFKIRDIIDRTAGHENYSCIISTVSPSYYFFKYAIKYAKQSDVCSSAEINWYDVSLKRVMKFVKKCFNRGINLMGTMKYTYYKFSYLNNDEIVFLLNWKVAFYSSNPEHVPRRILDRFALDKLLVDCMTTDSSINNKFIEFLSADIKAWTLRRPGIKIGYGAVFRDITIAFNEN